MCYCNPSIRTPCCGAIMCFPGTSTEKRPNYKFIGQGWARLTPGNTKFTTRNGYNLSNYNERVRVVWCDIQEDIHSGEFKYTPLNMDDMPEVSERAT